MRGPADLLAWRIEFPAVQRTVFLGSHTLAPASTRTRAAVERFLTAWETKASAERVWFDDAIPEMRRLEGLYARLIGADPAEVALSPSVTTALSSLGTSLDYATRNEVVLSRREFPTDQLAWTAMRNRGARIRWVEGSEATDYAAAIGGRTAAVSASRVSYLDAAITDAAAICAEARGAGALSVIDDFHGSGCVPIDVKAIGCDALVCGPYKYLLGSSNVAFVYVRGDVAPRLEPGITGWFAQRNFWAFDGTRIDWPDSAQRFTLGTPAVMSVYMAAAGLEIILEVGIERIRERSLE
ncbi:MAG: aminotransferase class V-fold PLP-dependent enzyme, partial [Actinomycetota bacterium]